jgi:uncharacterized protein
LPIVKIAREYFCWQVKKSVTQNHNATICQELSSTGRTLFNNASHRVSKHKRLITMQTASTIQITSVKVDKPETTNFVLGQSHFIKTVEDIHEALVNTVPGIKFGLAFCESSGDALVRTTGTDNAMVELARKNALNVGAGHSFFLFLGDGFYPINILNALKWIPEVCRIYCATANPAEVIVAVSDTGRGILGVIDGVKPKGVEEEGHVKKRKELLRAIGYKLG